MNTTKNCYFRLSLAIVLLYCVRVLFGGWYGDFWAHSAVVRELAAHPFSPGHPQLNIDADHEFFSPYTLAVGIFSRVSGLGAVNALAVAGIINLTLLFIFLRVFLSKLQTHKEAAFYTLLFMLFLWGNKPWKFSGFFHVRVLGYVAPYPSTFALVLVLGCFILYFKLVEARHLKYVLYIFILSTVVLLTHPFSFIILVCGICFLSLSRYKKHLITLYLILAGGIIISFLAALLWPYYDFERLIFSSTGERYHDLNRIMYMDVLEKIYPALFAVPLLFIRLKKNYRDSLSVMCLGLFAVYMYGGIMGKWGYGRVIWFAVLLLHSVIADWVATIEQSIRARKPISLQNKIMSVILIVLFSLGVFSSIKGCADYFEPTDSAEKRLQFTKKFIQQDDVVLTDIFTGYYVPTFGGKVVAVPQPLAFMPNHAERLNDVYIFFSETTKPEQRDKVLDKYNVKFVLLDKERGEIPPKVIEYLNDKTHKLYEDKRYTLLILEEFAASYFSSRKGE